MWLVRSIIFWQDRVRVTRSKCFLYYSRGARAFTQCRPYDNLLHVRSTHQYCVSCLHLWAAVVGVSFMFTPACHSGRRVP